MDENIKPDRELVDLFMRFRVLQNRLVKLNAELDNVRELIRQKGF
jgi:hypothetical protein